MNHVSRRRKDWRRLGLHGFRLLIFVVVVVLIRSQHAELLRRQFDTEMQPVDLSRLRSVFPDAVAAGHVTADGRQVILGRSDEPIGYVVQTSPVADDLIGFSGPTNVQIAFSTDDRIVGIDVISTGDTREHVDQILRDTEYLNAFRGIAWEDVASVSQIDSVSGATLTSMTIQASVVARLSGGRPSLKFPEPVAVDQARHLFADAEVVTVDEHINSLWHVYDSDRNELGTILVTSPYADNIVGYQGPTRTLIGFDMAGVCQGMAVGKSYDNEPYVGYVREDAEFTSLFNGLGLNDLIGIDPNGTIEGVSGATMTSMAVTDGLILAAQQYREAQANAAKRVESAGLKWVFRDLGTLVVIAMGIIIAMTSLRGNGYVRIGFQLVLIGYLGIANGAMISQAMIAGWAKTSIPWQSACGLVMLTAVALIAPFSTGRNVYCTHLCPHGAAQQLAKNRIRLQFRMPDRTVRWLKGVPALLLVWCVVVTTAELSFSLVDIEPFDAWVFRVAGWATISIAIVGLFASLFVPMAYCRYGCPTGALLGYLRFHSRSDRWSRSDTFAVILTSIALVLWKAV